MYIFRKTVVFVVLWQALTVCAGAPEDLIFRNGFERCDNFTILEGSIEWDGGGDGESWSDPLNWKGDVLPANDDKVSIGDDGGITVIYDSSLGTTRIAAMDSCESLSVTGGTPG